MTLSRKTKKRLTLLCLLVALCLVIKSYVTPEWLATKVAPPLAKKTAKAYVAVSDLEKIKQLNAQKIAMMKQSRYESKVARAYHDLVTLGGDQYALDHAIREKMSKQEVILRIQNLTKDKIYAAIDDFPEKVISNLIKRDQNKPYSKKGLIKLLDKVQKKAEEELTDEYNYLKN